METENKVINELKKYEYSEVNRSGMMKALKKCKDYPDSLIKFYIYLTNPSNLKTRDAIFRYIYKLRGIEINEE